MQHPGARHFMPSLTGREACARSAAAIAVAGGLFVTLAGIGSLSPGDLQVLRKTVATAQSEQGSGAIWK